jgi:hypothetical protein
LTALSRVCEVSDPTDVRPPRRSLPQGHATCGGSPTADYHRGMADDDDHRVEDQETRDDPTAPAAVTARYPMPDITPREFEEFVADVLAAAAPQLEAYTVTLQDQVEAPDGTYTFDATVRYELAGFAYLVLIEAKRHKNPIKREAVQTLHQKMQSVGGQKAILVSTSPFQSGALEFAKQHGIALVTVTEGRFTIETRSADAPPVPTREAAARLGVPTFVGHAYAAGDTPGSTVVIIVSPQHPEHIEDLLRPDLEGETP